MSSAERKRRERERKKRGEIAVRLFVSRQTRDVLTEARWIGEWDEDNREAVENALQMLVDGISPVTRDGSS